MHNFVHVIIKCIQEPGKSEDNLEDSTKRAQEDEDAISVNDDILNDELKNISDKEEETDDNDDDGLLSFSMCAVYSIKLIN